MKDFYRYLTINEEDKQWGIYLCVAGRATVPPGSGYPLTRHPSSHTFSLDRDRVLQEYQVNYISAGQGMLQNEFGRFEVRPGTVMITRPGVRHRYRPNMESGWVENYVGIDGHMASSFFTKSVFASGASVLYCGLQEELIETYYQIFDLVLNEEPGFQQIVAGMTIKLLGQISALNRRQDFSGKPIENIIRKLRMTMHENLDSDFSVPDFAEANHVTYAYLRKMFKKYTGMSPHQYFLDLKLMRARTLILTTDRSVKDISLTLGFDSIHYFSRWFKKRLKVSPRQLRSSN